MHKKRGQAFYAEIVNPSAKKHLVQCSLCGRVGLKPDASGVDYDTIKDEKTIKRHQKLETLSQKIAIRSLQRVYEPLPLDKFGHCEICAKASESSSPVV
jgi:hypothetical protein